MIPETFYRTAASRRAAMAEGTAPEPKPFRPMYLPKKQARSAYGAPFHWVHSRCVENNYCRWKRETRDRVLDGAAFNALPESEQCVHCLPDFLNA
jgi:hypothetical protein